MGVITNYLNRRGAKGNFLVMWGSPDSGKTNLLGNIIEGANKDGFENITSMLITNQPTKYHYITGIEDMLSAYAKCEGKILITIDDAQGTFDSSSQATTRQSKMLFKLYIHLAKLQANLCLVVHDPKKIPSSLIEFNPLYVRLIQPGEYEIIGYHDVFVYPKTKYKFNKASFSGFENENFPLNDLFNHLSKIKGKSNEEQIRLNKEAIIDFINNGDSNNDLPVKQQAEVILKALGPYMGRKLSQKLIAECLKVDPGYISRIKKSL